MAQHTVTLEKGIIVGTEHHKKAVLKELSAGDLIAAMEESERLIMVPGSDGPEPQLVMSNALLGINTLRRQIESIGDINGPIEREQLALLSHTDMELLQVGVQELDVAIGAALVQRGRSEAAGSDGKEESE